MEDSNNCFSSGQTPELPTEESMFHLVVEQYGIMETMAKAESSSSSKEFSCQIQEKVDERPSSPTDCAICLEQLTDKSFTNSCLHMFCFHCLLAWSKIKPECPLCKQDFCSIIHNIRSMTDYDEYHVPPPEAHLSLFVNPDITPSSLFTRDPQEFFSNNRSFVSYRTTIMSGAYRLPRGRPDNLLIRPYVDNLEIQADFSRLHSDPTAYSRCNRREIYLKELETLPPPSAGRYRECAPDFYRENEGQIHRLIRWLQRELAALSLITTRFSTSELLRVIMDMLTVYHINSTTFFNTINRYLGQHTTRFIREFHRFATSPFEMEQYDRDCIYVRQRSGSQLSFIVTVGRDDSEDVQIIPNATNHSFRPWIDVNDLGRAQSSTSTNDATPQSSTNRCPGIGMFSDRQNTRSAQTDQPSTSSGPQTIINISDSENDDCVIIDQVRSIQETIILDDSEDERSNVKVSSEEIPSSRLQPGENRLSSTSSRSIESVDLTSSTISIEDRVAMVKNECDKAIKELQKKKAAAIVAACSNHHSSHDSSVMSTDPSSTEAAVDNCIRKSKRKRSKKYYRVRDMKRQQISSNYVIGGSSDELIMLTEDSDVETDKNDLDWEKSYKRRKKTKKTNGSKNSLSKKQCQVVTRSIRLLVNNKKETRNTTNKCHQNTIDVEAQTSETRNHINLPRLQSVVEVARTRSAANHDNPKNTTVNICACGDINQLKNEPCTSHGIHHLHRESCEFYSVTPISRNTYSSDSD